MHANQYTFQNNYLCREKEREKERTRGKKERDKECEGERERQREIIRGDGMRKIERDDLQINERLLKKEQLQNSRKDTKIPLLIFMVQLILLITFQFFLSFNLYMSDGCYRAQFVNRQVGTMFVKFGWNLYYFFSYSAEDSILIEVHIPTQLLTKLEIKVSYFFSLSCAPVFYLCLETCLHIIYWESKISQIINKCKGKYYFNKQV